MKLTDVQVAERRAERAALAEFMRAKGATPEKFRVQYERGILTRREYRKKVRLVVGV